jgi:hypothetical protein
MFRVVAVRERAGWLALLCTGPAAAVADILGAVADRFALEQSFKDLKEVWDAAQQVRTMWACVGAYPLNLWQYTLTELWVWDRAGERLVGRAASPGYDPTRRSAREQAAARGQPATGWPASPCRWASSK